MPGQSHEPRIGATPLLHDFGGDSVLADRDDSRQDEVTIATRSKTNSTRKASHSACDGRKQFIQEGVIVGRPRGDAQAHDDRADTIAGAGDPDTDGSPSEGAGPSLRVKLEHKAEQILDAGDQDCILCASCAANLEAMQKGPASRELFSAPCWEGSPKVSGG